MTRRSAHGDRSPDEAIAALLKSFLDEDSSSGAFGYGSPSARLRESRDPKWDVRRAGLTAALEAKRKAQQGATKTPGESRPTAEGARIADLEGDVARLTLVTMTMMEMVIRKGIATREELSALLAEIDVLDGRRDGKLPRSALRPTTKSTEPAGGGAPATT